MDSSATRRYGDLNVEGPTKLCCDNKSAIYIAKNHTFHERTKHIEMDCHYVREAYLKGVIDLPYVTSEYQLADFFTKSLCCSAIQLPSWQTFGHLCPKFEGGVKL